MDGQAASAFKPDESIEVYPGLFQDWYAGHSMVVYRLTLVTQSLIEVWSKIVLDTLTSWDKQRPYLAMHDLSASGVSTIYASLTSYDMMNIVITADGKTAIEQILNEHPGFVARVAIAFNITLSGHIGKTLLNYYTDKHPAIQYKSFYSQDKSLRWLASHIQSADQSSSANA